MDQILDVILKKEQLNNLDLRRQDFTVLYPNAQSIISFLEESVKETEFTKTIESLSIPLDTHYITLRLKDRVIKKEDFTAAVDKKVGYQNYFADWYDWFLCKKHQKMERIVTVKMIDCGCFF